MFDLKTNPWVILVHNQQHFNNVNQWLLKNFGDQLPGVWDCIYREGVKGITNIDAYGKIEKHVMWVSDRHLKDCHKHIPQIKIDFETVVKSVEYPEYKSESEKQLDAVREKLAELQKEAEQLQETIKKEKK